MITSKNLPPPSHHWRAGTTQRGGGERVDEKRERERMNNSSSCKKGSFVWYGPPPPLPPFGRGAGGTGRKREERSVFVTLALLPQDGRTNSTQKNRCCHRRPFAAQGNEGGREGGRLVVELWNETPPPPSLFLCECALSLLLVFHHGVSPPTPPPPLSSSAVSVGRLLSPAKGKVEENDGKWPTTTLLCPHPK